MSEYESDRMPEYRIPGRMSECMSDRVPGYMSDRMPEYMSDRMPEYRIPGRMSGCMSEYMATSSRISEKIYQIHVQTDGMTCHGGHHTKQSNFSQ